MDNAFDDVLSQTLSISTNLVARAAATSENGTITETDNTERPPIYKVVGIVLAVCSGLFIGVSFVVKKVGLLKANVKYQEEAGEGYGYLRNWWWWTGMTLMIIGEICNFVAYAFTDAILVTPLGALSVVVTTILSAIFLKERLSFVGKVGCFIAILGAVVIVLNAPEQAAVNNIQQMKGYVLAPGFLSYAGIIIAGSVFVAIWVAPRYGKQSMMVYLTICSLIGGLSVVATQGLGAAILAHINGKSQFNQWFLYVLFVFVIGTLLTEIIYLNKALNLFNAALVTPTYYVYFTSSTIIASAILFRGFGGTTTQIIQVVLGFLIICSGVVLLQLAKSSKDVPDTAVFQGDLDQIRTVGQQEEPEYEPRADAIRGGAGIVRAVSKIRTEREAEEAKRIHQERMQPVGEDTEFEWDGLRRRATSTLTNSSGRRKPVQHPPLGMSHFPDVDEDQVSNPESDIHPGFFGRIGGRSRRNTAQQSQSSGKSPVALGTISPSKMQPDEPLPDRDTSYPGAAGAPAGSHTHLSPQASEPGSSHSRPRPPLHSSSRSAKRQFSFQSVFGRRPTDAPDSRPVTSRSARSFVSRTSSRDPGTAVHMATEEERLGLVHGDSTRHLPQYDEAESEAQPSAGSVDSSRGSWQLAEEPPSSSEHAGGENGGRQSPGEGPADPGR